MDALNKIWKFFASVKLALFTLCAISLTSIIGTIIPQDRSFAFYAEKYGDELARLFFVFDFQDMYGAFWFNALLGLLSANLIICSIDRFPAVWKIIIADQSLISPNKLRNMPFSSNLTGSTSQSTVPLIDILKRQGWKIQTSGDGQDRIISAQKGAWTRTGVYIVHASILVIFAGAIVGQLLGFKGSVMIPETKQTATVYSAKTQQPIPLGFEVRCDLFEIEFYDNGMPKEYMSRLRVFEKGQEITVKDIEVNSPLKYKGITFYQSSYEGYRDFVIKLKSPVTQNEKTFIAPYQQEIVWKEEQLRFGVIKAEVIGDRVVRAKIWFQAADNPPVESWLESKEFAPLQQGEQTYSVSVKQMYATGLQVAKDPGVWIVYLGCFLMMFGLYLAFFMSHRRIWIFYDVDSRSESIKIAGTTNKNKLGFEKSFSELTDKLLEDIKR